MTDKDLEWTQTRDSIRFLAASLRIYHGYWARELECDLWQSDVKELADEQQLPQKQVLVASVNEQIEELQGLVEKVKKGVTNFAAKNVTLKNAIIVECDLLNMRLQLGLYHIDQAEEYPDPFPDKDCARWGDAEWTQIERDAIHKHDGLPLVQLVRLLRECRDQYEIPLHRLKMTMDLQSPSSTPMSAKQERNEWLYELAIQYIPWEQTIQALHKRIREDKPQWDAIDSVNGVKAAAEKHITDNPGLPRFGNRKPGRPSKK